MIKMQARIKTVILPNAPLKFKKEVGALLNQLMKDHKIKGKDKEFEDVFKRTFKSNLYYIIDNHFQVKGTVITAEDYLKEIECRLDIKKAGMKLMFPLAGKEHRENVKKMLQDVLKDMRKGKKKER